MDTLDRRQLPIGVFDSGIGGLSVLSVLQKRFPHERFIYVGDNQNNPVGNKEVREIQSIAENIVNYLMKESVKMIVIACNTFSVGALEYLQQQFDIPIIGMAQGVSDTLAITSTGPVGILGTVATIESHKHMKALQAVSPSMEVIEQGCRDLAAFIENGHLHDEEVLHCATSYIEPLVENNVKVIILGCTHYPLIEDIWQSITKGDIPFVDPASETCDRVEERLYGENMESCHKDSSLLDIRFTRHREGLEDLVQSIFSDRVVQVKFVTV